MSSPFRWFPCNIRLLCLIAVAGFVLISCKEPPPEAPPYERAKDAFKSGYLDKALDLTEKLATAKPPVDVTERAQVLRAVISTGQLKGAKALAESYSKGAEKAKDPKTSTEFRRAQNDVMVIAVKAAMTLAQSARQIAPNGVIAKELTLEASFPTIEGPTDIKQLASIEKGEALEPDQQASALKDSLHKGVDDALADAVAGDRAKARQALEGGSTKLAGTAFAIFLAQELVDAATIFDSHHSLDPSRFKVMCDEGEESLKAALALLKDAPDKDQEKAIKKLQDKFKAIRKSMS